MKNFSSRTRGNSLLNYKEATWIKPVLAIGFIIFILLFLKSLFGMVASFVTLPLYYVQHYVETSTHTIPTFFRSRTELLGEIESLKRERDALIGGDARTLQIERENEELRALFTELRDERTILAGIIGKPPHTPYDTVILDQGSEAGIIEGAPVFFGQGLALGYVRTVRSNTSYVTLFSSPEVETTVYIFGPNIFATAYGEGNGVIRISVPQGILVSSGDLVVLPSLDAHILGRIGYIKSTPTEPEQSAYISGDSSLQSVRVVSVGTSSVIPMSFDDALTTVSEFEREQFTIPIPSEYYASTTPVYEGISTTTP